MFLRHNLREGGSIRCICGFQRKEKRVGQRREIDRRKWVARYIVMVLDLIVVKLNSDGPLLFLELRFEEFLVSYL